MYAPRTLISGRQLLAAPAIEPLTVAEVVTQLRLDATNVEPVPAAPTVALAGAGAGSVTNGVHRYRVTFVTAVGETDGGIISQSVTVANNAVDGRVNLTNIALGGSLVTARKIYRTLAAGSAYFLVATLADNTTTVFTDNVADGALGVQVPATNTTADPELSALITTARLIAERTLRRPLIQQQWRFFFDCFPYNEFDELYLPLPPLLSVQAFKYKTWTDGSLTDVLAAVYTVDVNSVPGRIIKNYAQFWPVTYPQRNAVQIDVTCGYGPNRSDVPQPIKDGMKLLISGMWQNPSAYTTDDVKLSPVINRCWDFYRYKEF
jgi:uncharacterized phiE125 gp8 family phage protein